MFGLLLKYFQNNKTYKTWLSLPKLHLTAYPNTHQSVALHSLWNQ